MDSAKAAVQDFMAKSGHNDTTVHEKVAPAVTHETINRTKHEDVQTAIDKEVHQDHYHTSVQPVVDRQILPESHHHNIVPVEHRQFEHDSPEAVQQRLRAEQAKFRDEQIRVEGQTTSSVAPVVAGEHIHHHVHETIQPVVNRETIEPHIVHTTVPIHEVHHNATQHHATSALPAVSMSDFKNQGGVLSGREERYDGFQGEPRQIGGSLGGERESGMTGASSMGASGLEGRSTDMGGSNMSGTSSGIGSHQHSRDANDDGMGTQKKPSLMDKLNPKVDSDGDGKAGFMK
ncbi:hypothetical protein LTS02_014439 [Friedmanniomyces endolithicus]|nr:hypothetical protein LTR94_013401 [Friedmanniomyces endolithicus]KAK0781668.1 hypothetical protein LTR59_012393 [Friedmanniomyces endolithicus]KAK0786588.1 hypothetical protein LTR38_011951 [Friedmanniomyces endolithicus]KAK0789600.1 hypothetical protein LTR75_012281 [Friedmanniomyces endolithicus]KAK0847553.1 hypothetical protein LTS02_014439 [Friedmanniomyces endolithicus]